ncbi:MAG: acetylxylan esterase [Verrucomicrobia bacterium]|nr:acetylxylan esterase [Verrucomicrobiota bacterium]
MEILFSCLFALALLAPQLRAAETTPVASGAAGERIDRYALEHYLTDLAEGHWSARRTTLANLKSPADVTARASYIRSEFIKAIGGFPDTRTPLNARITGTLERDGYRIEKLIYESLPGFFVTANVYVPTGRPGPFPAILGTAGHASVGKALPAYQTAFIALAKRGNLVLAYDPPVQGERMEYLKSPTGKPRPMGHIIPGLQCLLTGGTVARYFLWDGMRSVDYLLTRSDVDPKRLGAAGNSGGGTQSAFLGVGEPRLAAVAPSCYWTSWEKLWIMPASGPQDSEQVVPNFIKNGLGFSDLAIAFAPKPILMLTATRDFFPVEGARDSHAQAKPAFALLGAADKLGYFEYDDPHGWSQPRREATCRWFDQWFFGRNDPVTEPADIKPEDAATLHCTTTGDVVTALQSKTVQMLNQDLAERLLAKRTIKQAANPARAREIVAARLATKLQRSAPTATVVQRGTLSGYQHEKVALVPEAGISLYVDIIQPARPAKSKSAVILVRESAGPDQPALDQEAATWVEAGHVVAITPLRGTLVMPEKADAYWQERYRTAMRAILIGKTMPGMRVQDLLAVHDYVSTRPGVGGRVVVVGRRNLGVVALYAAALEPKISRVVLDKSLLSYMEIVRARQYPETVSDLIVPGALLDFDLPDLADLAGAGRVVLANPLSAAGTPVSLAAATAAFGKNAHVVVDPSIAISKLMD